MAIITFMSDFGTIDHYTSAVKAKILTINPGINIVDISHHINPFDIGHASYVLGAVFREFPKGTVHLCAVGSGDNNPKYIALKLEEHFFVGNDNGLFNLISEKEPDFVAELMANKKETFTFPARDILAGAAAKIASGKNLDDVGSFTSEYERRVARKSRATKKQISGNVVHVDHYGNLITNIEEEVFNIICKKREFTVMVGREKIEAINGHSGEVEAGDCFVIFNSNGYLEIGINRGNASELLGLKPDSPVNIIFKTDE